MDIGGGTETIGPRDVKKAYSPLAPPNSPKNVPFDNFFTNDITSEQHIQFTLNNGNWLMAELDDNSAEAFFSCASTCANSLPLVVIGDDQICNSESATYFVNNLKSGVSVSWSVSPAGGFTMTSNGSNSVTLTPTGNFGGEAILTATMNTDCADVSVEKQIQTGAQRPIYYDENGEEQATFTFCMLNYDGLSFNTSPGVIEWEWTNNNSFYMTASNNGAQFYSSSPAFGVVSVRTRDDCGWSAPTFLVINLIDCSSGGGFGQFSMAQNPVSNGNLTVVENQNPDIESSNFSSINSSQNSSVSEPNITLELYDFTGNLRHTSLRQRNTIDRTYNLDVSRYEDGHYFIKITCGDIVEIYQIIIDTN